MDRKTEALVESLLGESALTEGDVHGLTSSMEGFDRVFGGDDFGHAYMALQSVKPDVWGHLGGEITGNVKSKLDTARVALTNLLQVAKGAVAKANAYKPPKEFQGYDSAAHSGEHNTPAHGVGGYDD